MALQVQTRQQKRPGLVYRQDHDQSRHWSWGAEMGLKKVGHSFSRGLHTTVFQPEILLKMIPPHSRSLPTCCYCTNFGTQVYTWASLQNFLNCWT